MANPSDHQAGQPGKGKISPFGCFVLGIMLLVILGGVAQLLTAKPNFKIVFLVILLAGVSLLVLYQVIKSGSVQETKHLNLDYQDRVVLEYLGMDEAYIDEGLDHRLKRSGERGEQQVAHALSWLPQDQYTVFNQIYITAKGRGQQFDHLVVGSNGVFHIETKNHAGRITITPDGNWEITRTIGGKVRTEGMENPLEQVRRHEIVLKDFLDELLGRHRVPVQEIVVIANPKTTIKGEQYGSFEILKREKLLDFILNYGKPGAISPDNRRRIANELEKRNTRTS